MGRAIGIDLGTTFSATAVLESTGEPVILPSADGDATTPSVVLFQDFGSGDEPLVGAMAKHQAATAPLDVVQFVKRHMGDPHWRFDSSAGETYTAEEVSAIILKRLKQDAELALDTDVTDAVITVPAYFDDARRTATRQAGKIAGLNVLRVLNEPTAAALAYGLDETRDATVLVYDLGGGTFDVTLMRIQDTTFDVVATDGDRNLGGFDFDNALIQYVADELAEQGATGVLDDMDALALLRERAEMAKRTLTTVASTNVTVTIGGKPYRVKVSRTDFEKACRSLLNRTRELVEDVLDQGRIGWKQVDEVLLVGGSTRMPMIREMVTSLSGKKPATDINPDEAVALGAAIQAAIEQSTQPSGQGAAPDETRHPEQAPEQTFGPAPFSGRDVTVRDVTSQALGVIVLEDAEHDREANLVVIGRNTKVPAEESRQVRTTYDSQTQVEVRVTQGDDTDPAFVVEIGRSMLSLPPYPQGAPLRITYHYDVDQTVFVELEDLTANRSLGTFEVERVANLTAAQVELAEAKIRAITVN
ncbi:molecular chaperone DnaK [Nocardioides albertanoniae]|uniref:Molecular chaperone DnaK n=2 Tax=Nocardioides albertanoniae TaxID=1175486 RepID=A0A543A902_9ACTN|nr:molecular chaperone DnaK [Nocardioides albertanoniae]